MIQFAYSVAAAFAMATPTPGAHSLAIGGAVRHPGALTIERTMGLSEAIRRQGGFRPEADRRRVEVLSASGARRTVDLTKLGLIEPVEPGDRVFVPKIDPSRSVLVQGGVENAGAFDFRPGMTVQDLFVDAKLSSLASPESIRIYRPDKSGTIEVKTANLLASTAPMALRPGDTVYVPRANAQFSDRELLTIIVIGLLILVIVD